MPLSIKGKQILVGNQKIGYICHTMAKRRNTDSILGRVAYVLDCILLAAFVLLAVGVLVRTIRMDIPHGRLELHGYLLIGFAVFFLSFLIPRVRKNVGWLMKFTHELTHLVFAILFFRKIHRFNVDNKDSHVSFSGGWFGYTPITLSPYCVPIFTLALLPWRFTTGTATPVFLAAIDLLIGFTYAFHVCCWIKQTRLHQTDITGPGIVRSLLFIALFQILFFCLVVLTPSSGVQLAIERVFWDFPRGVFLTVRRLLFIIFK